MNAINGRNAGITGLIDLPDAGGTPKFYARVYAWKEAMTASEEDIAGRGDGDWPEQAYLRSTGNLAVSAKIEFDYVPTPNNFIGQTGTITVTLSEDNQTTQTVPVRVTGCTISRDLKTQDLWEVGLACRITDNPTWNNWQGTNAAGTPSHANKELWAGMGKGIDPQSIADNAAQRILLYTLTDTDAAEVTAIGTIIAAATPPIAGLKLRPTSFERRSARVSIIGLTWGRTSTADDIVLPRTVTSIDPSGLQSHATTAAIGIGTNVATPPAPSTNAAFVLRDTATNKLHDNAVLAVNAYGLRSTEQDVTMEGSRLHRDTNSIEQQSTITVVTNTATLIATPTNCAGFTNTTDLVFHSADVQQLTPGKWRQSFNFSARDSKQAIEENGTFTVDDARGLEQHAQITVVSNTASIPPAPSAPTNSTPLVLRDTESRPITPTLSAYSFKYAAQTSQQEVENAHTEAGANVIEAMKLQSAAVVAAGTNTALSLAESLQAQYHSTITYDGAVVKPLNPGYFLQTLNSRSNNFLIEYMMRSTGKIEALGYVDGSNVMVYLNQIFYRGNGWYTCQVIRRSLYAARGMLRLVRRALTQGTGTNAISALPMHWELLNKVNDAIFEGYSAGQLTYDGIEGGYNIALPLPRVSHTVHQLLFDSLGHFKSDGIIVGWFHNNSTNLAGLSPGWVAASTFGGGWTNATPLPTSNFNLLYS